MNHLAEAKIYARQAESVSAELMQAYVQLATAHVGIALVERMDKAAERAEAEAEQAELAHIRREQDVAGWEG